MHRECSDYQHKYNLHDSHSERQIHAMTEVTSMLTMHSGIVSLSEREDSCIGVQCHIETAEETDTEVAQVEFKTFRISTDVDDEPAQSLEDFLKPGSPDAVTANLYTYEERVPRRRKRMAVVLDMDECLVHSRFLGAEKEYRQDEERPEMSDVYEDSFEIVMEDGERAIVNKRPGLDQFLREASKIADLYVFTAGLELYGKAVIDKLDPCNNIFKGRLYRDACLVKQGLFLKDLRKVRTDMCRVLLVDNNPISFLPQPSNGIPVPSFYDDKQDNSLQTVLEILRTLDAADDVRPVLKDMFNLSSVLEPHRKRIFPKWT